jgi:hypothetical protein
VAKGTGGFIAVQQLLAVLRETIRADCADQVIIE